jgi:hypothetical protein
LYDKNLKVASLELLSLARQKLPKGLGSNSLQKRTWDDDDDKVPQEEVLAARRVVRTAAMGAREEGSQVNKFKWLQQ